MTTTTQNQNVTERVGVPAPEFQESQPPVPDAESPSLANGIRVLEDGTPYVTLPQLARLCGVRPDVLKSRADSLYAVPSTRSSVMFWRFLTERGHDGDSLSFTMPIDGTVTECFAEPVFMALLEFFAFETSKGCREIALENYRALARTGGRVLVVHDAEDERWEDRNTRRSLHANVPSGYFAVFGVLTSFEDRLIASEYRWGDYEGFDGLVAKEWAERWVETAGDRRYVERIRRPHELPPWIPQPVDPVLEFVYPLDALVEFYEWLEDEFIPSKCPALRDPAWLERNGFADVVG